MQGAGVVPPWTWTRKNETRYLSLLSVLVLLALAPTWAQQAVNTFRQPSVYTASPTAVCAAVKTESTQERTKELRDSPNVAMHPMGLSYLGTLFTMRMCM